MKTQYYLSVIMAGIHILGNCLLNKCLFLHFRDPDINDSFILSIVPLMSDEKDLPYIFVCPTHKFFHSCRGGNVCVLDANACCLMTQRLHVCRKKNADTSISYCTEIKQQQQKRNIFSDTAEHMDQIEKHFNKFVFIDTVQEYMENNCVSGGLGYKTRITYGIFHNMIEQLYTIFKESMRKDKHKFPANFSHRFDMASERIHFIIDSIVNHLKSTRVQQKRKQKKTPSGQTCKTSFQKDVQILISAYLLHGAMLPAAKRCIRWQDQRLTKRVWQRKTQATYWRSKNVK